MLFFILGYFLPFFLPNSLKNQNLKKIKKHLKISSFYKSVPKIMITCCTAPEIWHVMDVIIFHFGPLFTLLPPPPPPILRAQKIKIFKKWKKTPGDIILQMCTKNYDQKSDIWRWVPHLKSKGPRIDPWGTPHKILEMLEYLFSMLTKNSWSVKHE